MYMQHMAIFISTILFASVLLFSKQLAEVIPDYPTAYRDKIYRCRFIIGAVKICPAFWHGRVKR